MIHCAKGYRSVKLVAEGPILKLDSNHRVTQKEECME